MGRATMSLKNIIMHNNLSSSLGQFSSTNCLDITQEVYHWSDGASLGACNVSQWYKDSFKCRQFNVTSTRVAQVTGFLPLPLNHSSRITICLSPIALVFQGPWFCHFDPRSISGSTVLLCMVRAVWTAITTVRVNSLHFVVIVSTFVLSQLSSVCSMLVLTISDNVLCR